MNTCTLKQHVSALALVAAAFTSSAYAWQDMMPANMTFENQFNAQLAAMQRQNQMALQQL
ncbi:hypothetical protein BURK2_02312 [Burkholderiales bacterium]|nr:hypothetical protein BURK2_02312 [Burkholderiales bacterium]